MPRRNKNFDLSKLATALEPLIIRSINTHMSHLNNSIQDNLDLGEDIKNQPFTELSDTTIVNRLMKGQGTKPLVITGNMRKTKVTNAKFGDPVASIDVVGKSKGKKKIIYGAAHNKGYTNSRGVTVPKREWFGFTKDFKPGGRAYKAMIANIWLELKTAWKI